MPAVEQSVRSVNGEFASGRRVSDARRVSEASSPCGWVRMCPAAATLEPLPLGRCPSQLGSHGRDGERGAVMPLACGTHDRADPRAFRTSPLRNVELTGPGLPNGAFGALASAVQLTLDSCKWLRRYEPGQVARERRATVQDDQATLILLSAAPDPLSSKPVTLSEAESRAMLPLECALPDPLAADPTGDSAASVLSRHAMEAG